MPQRYLANHQGITNYYVVRRVVCEGEQGSGPDHSSSSSSSSSSIMIQIGLLAKVTVQASNSDKWKEILAADNTTGGASGVSGVNGSGSGSSGNGSGGEGATTKPQTLTHEQLLLKWVNYHLKAAKSTRVLANFHADLKDGEIVATLLKQAVSPYQGSTRTDRMNQLFDQFHSMTANMTSSTSSSNAEARMAVVAQMTDLVGAKTLFLPEDMIKGNKEHSVAFLAHLFDKFLNSDDDDNATAAMAVEQRNAAHAIAAEKETHLLQTVHALSEELERIKVVNSSLHDLHAARDESAAAAAAASAAAAIQEKASSSERVIRGLEEEIAQLKQQLEETEADNKTLRSQSKALQGLNKQLQARLVELTSEHEALVKSATNATTTTSAASPSAPRRLDDFATSAAAAATTSGNLELELRVREAKISSLQNQIQKCKNELELVQSERNRLQGKLEKCQQELITDRFKMDQLVAELEELREDIGNVRLERDHTARERADLVNEVASLQTQLQHQTQDAGGLQTNINTLEQKNRALTDQMDMIKTERRTLEKIAMEAFRNVETALQRARPTEAGFPPPVGPVQNVSTPPRKRGASSAIVTAAEEPSVPVEVHQLAEHLQHLVRNYTETIEKLESVLHEHRGATETLVELQSQTLPELKQDLDQMEQERDHLKLDVVPGLKSTVDQLQATIKMKDGEIARYQGMVHGLQGEKERWDHTEKRMMEARNLELAALNNQMQALQQQIHVRDSDIENWKFACDSLRAERRQINQEVLHANSAKKHEIDSVFLKAEQVENQIKQLKASMQANHHPMEKSEAVRAELAPWISGSGSGFYSLRKGVEEVTTILRSTTISTDTTTTTTQK